MPGEVILVENAAPILHAGTAEVDTTYFDLPFYLRRSWGGGTFGTYPCAVFQRCVQKLPDFLSSQNPSNTLERCVQELPVFLNPPPK